MFRFARLPSIGAAVSFLVLGLADRTSIAQPADGEPKRENVHIEGKLEDFGSGLLKVKDAAGETYLVKVEADPKYVSLNGKADVSLLARGMIVRFASKFDKKGQAIDPLRELAIFTPREGETPGVSAEATIGSIAGDIFSDPPDEANAKPKKPTAAPPPTYQVVGLIAGVKNGKIQVAAGDMTVSAKLSDDLRVSIDVADLSLAKKGDAVRLDGWRYPENKTKVVATQISITAAEPLAGARKPKPKTATPPAKEAKPAEKDSDPDKGADTKSAPAKTP